MTGSNLRWAANTLKGVLLDQKPSLDPAIPTQKALYDQMTRMFTGLFVSAAPEDYLTVPGENPEMAGFKGKYPDHGIGWNFIKECQTIRERLEKFGFKNFKILGEDFAYRKKGAIALNQYNDADLMILTKSDFHGFSQFLELLQTKSPTQPVVIDNYKGYWDDLITVLGGPSALKEWEAQGVYVVKKAKDLKALIAKIDVDPAKVARPVTSPFVIGPDSLILSNTGTTHKPNEQRESIEYLGARAGIVPLGLAIESAEAAPEISWSYEGNNYEKHANAYERMAELGAEEVTARLSLRGTTPEKVFILSSDSGIAFKDHDLLNSKSFEVVRNNNLPKLPHQMQPGTELAYLIERPVDNLIGGIREAYEAKLARLRKNDPEATVDLGVKDYTYFTVSPLVIPEGESWQDHAVTVFGATEDVFLLEPAKSKYGHVYSEHYMAPSDTPTTAKSDISGFMEGRSSIALGIKALMQMTQMQSASKSASLLQDFGKAVSNDNIFTVGTPPTVRTTKSLKHAFARVSCATLPASERNFGMDREIPMTIDIKTADGIVREIAYSRRHKGEEFASNVEAFWFPKVESIRSDLEKVRELKMLAQIIVNRQIYAPSSLNKAIIIGNPDLIRLIDNLHRMKLIGDRPHHLYEKADTHRQAASIAQSMLRRQFVRHNLPLPPREYGGKLDDEGLYRVAVFNSASTKNNELKDPEYAFSYSLAQNGFALVNGGGSQGSMLETQKGYAAGRNFNARTAQGKELIKTSSAAYQSYDTRKIEGMCRLPDFWSVEPTRGLRIDRLMDVNAIVAGAGGIGTVEEIVEEAENILLGGPTRPCVLVNMPINSGCKTVKCHDPVLELLPSSVVSQMQIVNTHEEAMEIIRKDRQDRGMDVQMVPNPNIFSFPERKMA